MALDRADRSARWFLTSPCGRAHACDFDHAPSSRWSLAARRAASGGSRRRAASRFYSLGVNVLDGGYPNRARRPARSITAGRRFAPTLGDWVAANPRRLSRWGFNSAGGWSLPPQQLHLPTVIDLELGRRAKFHWFDPFAPETEAPMMALARKLVAPYRGSPYRIGYFSDNEVGWWAGALFVFYSMQPAASDTKQRWVALLRAALRMTIGPRLPPISRRRPGSLRGRRCSPRTGDDPDAPGRQRHRGGARVDRDRRRALLRARRAGDPRRRPRRALFRRPAADLLRPGGGAGDGALCRCDRHQLQCRQRRRLDRALFLRRAARNCRAASRSSSDRVVLCRPRKTAPATATTAI